MIKKYSIVLVTFYAIVSLFVFSKDVFAFGQSYGSNIGWMEACFGTESNGPSDGCFYYFVNGQVTALIMVVSLLLAIVFILNRKVRNRDLLAGTFFLLALAMFIVRGMF